MQIKNEELKKLLQIIPPYPKVNIYHINDMDISSSKILYDFAKEKEYDYDLYTTDEKMLELLKEFGASLLDLNRARYNKHAKLYDFVFLNIDVKNLEDQKKFFTKIYHICKNAAKVLLFLEEDSYDLERLLEDLNFVAINYIDISQNYKILSAQKMHGWGVYDL